jgi:hypothetical protein
MYDSRKCLFLRFCAEGLGIGFLKTGTHRQNGWTNLLQPYDKIPMQQIKAYKKRLLL